MQFLKNLFFIIVAAGASLHSAHATTIYKCKQADGKVAFQEMPCALSDAQSVVSQPIRTAAPKATPVSTPEPSDTEVTEYVACRQTGIKVFDPTRPQGLQHPQAAFNLCKKTLPSPMNQNGICLDACVQAWVGEYKKKYINKGQ